MKRKKISIILILLLGAVLVILVVKKELLSRERMFPEIPENITKEVEQLFQVELPERGNMIYYDALLKKDDLGHYYAEIELPEKYYEEMITKIEEKYFVSELNFNSIGPENTFETTLEEVDKHYLCATGLRRTVEMEFLIYTVYYFIHITEIEDGMFRVLFSSGAC